MMLIQTLLVLKHCKATNGIANCECMKLWQNAGKYNCQISYKLFWHLQKDSFSLCMYQLYLVDKLHRRKSSKSIYWYPWLSLCIICWNYCNNRHISGSWKFQLTAIYSINFVSRIECDVSFQFCLCAVLCKFINEFCVLKLLLISFTFGYFVDIFPHMHSYSTITD